jgi:YVTN family beta-propeller protein
VVAITPDGACAYVANTLSNNVSVIDTSTNTVLATVAVEKWAQAIGQFHRRCATVLHSYPNANSYPYTNA